jgi:hypothetical protein
VVGEAAGTGEGDAAGAALAGAGFAGGLVEEEAAAVTVGAGELAGGGSHVRGIRTGPCHGEGRVAADPAERVASYLTAGSLRCVGRAGFSESNRGRRVRRVDVPPHPARRKIHVLRALWAGSSSGWRSQPLTPAAVLVFWVVTT